MYITIKDIDRTNEGLEPSTINLVDALFSTDNLDDVHDVTSQQFIVIDKDGNKTNIDQVVIY